MALGRCHREPLGQPDGRRHRPWSTRRGERRPFPNGPGTSRTVASTPVAAPGLFTACASGLSNPRRSTRSTGPGTSCAFTEGGGHRRRRHLDARPLCHARPVPFERRPRPERGHPGCRRPPVLLRLPAIPSGEPAPRGRRPGNADRADGSGVDIDPGIQGPPAFTDETRMIRRLTRHPGNIRAVGVGVVARTPAADLGWSTPRSPRRATAAPSPDRSGTGGRSRDRGGDPQSGPPRSLLPHLLHQQPRRPAEPRRRL